MKQSIYSSLPAVIAVACLLVSPCSAAQAHQAAPAAGQATGNSASITHPDLVYAVADGEPLKMDLYAPVGGGGGRPVILFIHGGGWRSGGKEVVERHPDVLDLVHRGVIVASVDYRLSDTAKWPAQLHDVKAAVRFLKARHEEFGLDPERIVAWGKSAGAHLALMLATTSGEAELEGSIGGSLDQSSRVAGVAAFLPPTDLPSLLQQCAALGCVATGAKSDFTRLLGCDMGESESCRQRAAAASPVSHISADDPPAFIVSGDSDKTVPYQQGVAVFESLRRAGVDSRLFVVPGGQHGHPPTWEASFGPSSAWVLALLGIQ